MKTLCMDSAHKHLIFVLLEDGNVVASLAQECWKRQSETLFPALIALMEEAHWKADDIDEVVITDGPGSYTGVRIAMTVAKVLCTRKHIPLYCISTLQLYAGMPPHTFVMLDARSSRAYTSLLDEGKFLLDEGIMTLDEVKAYLKDKDVRVVGETELIDLAHEDVDFVENFQALRPLARRIDNVHTLTPRYLKENDAYLVK